MIFEVAAGVVLGVVVLYLLPYLVIGLLYVILVIGCLVKGEPLP